MRERLSRIVAALVPIGFLMAGLIRAAPYADDVDARRSAGEDWLRYKQNAVSILEEGLSMPAVAGPYRRPGGFLYNYFLAALFRLFGVNSSLVYVVQSALVGLAISVTYLVFRRYLSWPGGLVLVGALTGSMYVDFFRVYTFRLLSENLFMFLVPLALWMILRTHERHDVPSGVAAGVLVGGAVLTRPNVVLFGPAAAVLLALYAPRDPFRRLLVPGVFAAALLVTVSLLPVRDYVVSGHAGVAVLTDTGDWIPADSRGVRPGPALTLDNVVSTAAYYGRRVLFMMGGTTVLEPSYRVRTHWLIIWAGFAAFIGFAAVHRRLEFWQALLVAFILLYLGPLVAVAMITNYGFRMIVPAVPALCVLAVYAGEQLLRNPTELKSSDAWQS
jgi:hypothetical protein